jgi:hypothetical protein
VSPVSEVYIFETYISFGVTTIICYFFSHRLSAFILSCHFILQLPPLLSLLGIPPRFGSSGKSSFFSFLPQLYVYICIHSYLVYFIYLFRVGEKTAKPTNCLPQLWHFQSISADGKNLNSFTTIDFLHLKLFTASLMSFIHSLKKK